MSQINGTVLFDASSPRAVQAVAPAPAVLPADGFALPSTLAYYGRQLDKARAQFSGMPFAEGVCEGIAAQIRAERRKDKVVEARTLTMRDDGAIVGPEGNAIRLTAHSFRQLVSLVLPSGGASYLAACPPALRAVNVNHFFRTSEAGRKIKARIRVIDGVPEIFAFVGENYASLDGDRCMAQLAAAIPQGFRAEGTYDGTRWGITLIAQSDMAPVLGEVFKASIRLWGADDGTGSIRGAGAAYRPKCLNLSIFTTDALASLRRRHTGTQRSITADVRLGIDRALRDVDTFRRQWTNAAAINVVEQYEVRGSTGVRAIVGALVDAERVAAPGGRETVVDAVMRAWDKEPGYAVTDVVNAVTRAAHETTWSSPWATDDLQRQAGALLAAPDWARVAPILPTA